MFSIKALAVATAVSAGVVLAMPLASQAMPQSAPVKVDTATNNNIVNVHYSRRWARYCRYHPSYYRCHRVYVYRYRYYRPYYGYYPYYPYYGPRYYYRPGLHLPFGMGIY